MQSFYGPVDANVDDGSFEKGAIVSDTWWGNVPYWWGLQVFSASAASDKDHEMRRGGQFGDLPCTGYCLNADVEAYEMGMQLLVDAGAGFVPRGDDDGCERGVVDPFVVDHAREGDVETPICDDFQCAPNDWHFDPVPEDSQTVPTTQNPYQSDHRFGNRKGASRDWMQRSLIDGEGLIDGLAPADSKLCSACCRCAGQGGVSDITGLWTCSSCRWQQRQPGVASNSRPVTSRAMVIGVSDRGVELLPSEANPQFQGKAGSRTSQLLWSDLQPSEKPHVSAGCARLQWKFYFVDLKASVSEWRRGAGNKWEVDTKASEQLSSEKWNTGHLEVGMNFAIGGNCHSQMKPAPGDLQTLQLAPDLPLCLEHRRAPLTVWHGGPCSARKNADGQNPWPNSVEAWTDAKEYAETWKRLLWMEAATNGVTESDSKILGGVAIDWLQLDCGKVVGKFSIPNDLKDAHFLKLRVDDMLCVRWRYRAPIVGQSRTGLIRMVFESLDTCENGMLNADDLLPFGRYTGFQGSTIAWYQEFASLCRDMGCDDARGIDQESFESLVDDSTENGCYCSDSELKVFLQHNHDSKPGCTEPTTGEQDHDGTVTWIVHGLVEEVGDSEGELDVRFRICEPVCCGGGLSGVHVARRLSREGVTSDDGTIELLSLPESYHYAATALCDFAVGSLSVINNLVLRGGLEAAVDEGNEKLLPSLLHFKLNQSQEEAVQAALREPVALIHGPPGTGKTRTASALALTFARLNAENHAKACVLYAASGNKAVDVAVQSISELCVERLEDLFQAQSSEDDVCSICMSDGCNVITFCGHVFHRHCLTQALRKGGPTRKCPICRSTLKGLDGVRLLRVYSSDTERLEFPVPKKYEYEGVRERRRRTVPEEMRRFALHWRIHCRVAGHDNPFAAECGAAYERLVAEGVAGPEYDTLRTKYLEFRQKARVYEIQHCNIVLTTSCSCRRTWLSQLLQQEVELKQVIADEASTTTEPEALCPLTLAKSAEHFVLVGDHRQLRPVVKNRDAALLGLGRSLFERLSKQKEQFDSHPSLRFAPSVLLRQQYRMHPSMNRFPSQHFYGGQVGDDESTTLRPAGLLLHPSTRNKCATIFWQSPGRFQEEVQEVASRDASTRSKVNRQEAERCAQLAAALRHAGAKSVAVLSWYNAQVAELRTRVTRAAGDGVHVGSVVTAQGSEWDYVLLSTVRSSVLTGGARGDADASEAETENRRVNRKSVAIGCLADRHLLNVAVTRGRLGIIVFGCTQVLQSNHHWSAFLRHCQNEGGYLEPGEEPLLASAVSDQLNMSDMC